MLPTFLLLGFQTRWLIKDETCLCAVPASTQGLTFQDGLTTWEENMWRKNLSVLERKVDLSEKLWMKVFIGVRMGLERDQIIHACLCSINPPPIPQLQSVSPAQREAKFFALASSCSWLRSWTSEPSRTKRR